MTIFSRHDYGPAPAGRTSGALFEIHVLGDFRVTRRGVAVRLPESTWRCVALLATGGQPVRRHRAAAVLWPDKDESRASANLRSCLWRVRQAAPGLIDCEGDPVGLGPRVNVDLADLHALAARLEVGAPVDLASLDPTLCCADLLPDFYDDFVDEQREIVRQQRIRALELVGRRLLDCGDHWGALQSALLAVSQAPLRESAHQLVLEIHLSEGNVSEALRHYETLRRNLSRELGIRPSERMRRTMAAVVRGPSD